MSLASFRIAAMAVLPVLVLMFAPPAMAQMESREAIALQDQILELRHELQMLQAQGGVATGAPQAYYAQPAPPATSEGSDIVPQLLSRVNALEQEMRDLRGQVDELRNAQQQATADLGKRIDDLRFQLQNPQTAAVAAPAVGATVAPPRTAPATGGLTAHAATPPPPASPGPRTPEIALQEGYAALARRDYTAAESDAQEVLSRRASPRAYDAQYLLAQALAGQHQWSRAAIAYDDTYNRSRKGNHADEALLGLANSLTAINEKRAACDTLNKLHTEFPHTRPALRDQIAAANERAGCHA